MIRTDIDYLDDLAAEAEKSTEEDRGTKKIIGSDYVSLGSSTPPKSFVNLETEHQADNAFLDFCKKLAWFFSTFLGHTIRIAQNDQVYPKCNAFHMLIANLRIDNNISIVEGQL